MYVRVLQDELKFPDDRVMDQDTKSLIRGVSGCVEAPEEVVDWLRLPYCSSFNATLRSE